MSPHQSFHTNAFDQTDAVINFQKRIKVNDDLVRQMALPDGAISLLLLEKLHNSAGAIESPPSSMSASYSQPLDDETLTTAVNCFVQCREVAYGRLKYAEILSALREEQDLASNRFTIASEIPFYATQFSHPEIGRLSVRMVIDDVPRFRQLLTNGSGK